MLRRLHSIPGLVAALVVSFMAITGAVLSLQPLVERVSVPSGGGMSVATLTDKVLSQMPQTESIVRSASGAITAYVGRAATGIDPVTGASLGVVDHSAIFTFFTELHRSMFLGDGGRIAAGIAAAAMVVLATTGIALLINRMGGWRQLFATARGTLSQRLHVEVARLVVIGLMLSALTGLYMTLVTFGLVADGGQGFGLPAYGSGAVPAPVASLAALQDVLVADLRTLVLPAAGDAQDVFTLTTNAGTGYVDQASGELLDFTPNSPMQTLYEAIYTLHTGQGHWWLGVLLGLASLGVPLLMITGTVIWLRRRASMPRIPGDAGWRKADTVILIGSESNTTWSFAGTLHAALMANGHAVHVAPMNSLRAAYPVATRFLVLTATYGNGTAPSSASRFMERLAGFDGTGTTYAVLGFGDRKFRHFCAYAETVEAALADHGLVALTPYAGIDRQSAQAFAQWGRALGTALGEPLDLLHQPTRPQTRSYRLIERQDYGIEVQAPTVLLRFALPEAENWQDSLKQRLGLGGFVAGDLAGIIPPADPIPRYYSIAASSADGVLEICVRKQQGGVCSDYLFDLRPGDSVDAFVRPNPDFRPDNGRRPLILIGAGAGVAPLVGFVRANFKRRPVYLFSGGRDPASDFFYRDELAEQLAAGRLTRLLAVFSRVIGGQYVQHRLLDEADQLRDLVQQGARFMVCGSTAMGDGVRATLDTVLAPLDLSVERLQSAGRYAEDVY